MAKASDPAAFGLPHREPFVFVDDVLEVNPGRTATCRKMFAASEPFFSGHFPGDPIVPGVLLTEALAQTAGIAAGQAGKSYRLSAIKQMKFFAPVRPDSTVLFEASKSVEMAGLFQFHVRARNGEDTVAEGEIILSEL